MARLWQGRSRPEHVFRIPEDMRIYAVGDVHGCLASLQKLEALIDRSSAGFRGTTKIVFLGDYVDRGPDVSGVIEHLRSGRFAGHPAFFLVGNHEDMLLRIFEEPALMPAWLRWGGMATLASYGVGLPRGVDPDERNRILSAALYDALPPTHLQFLQNLQLHISIGDYLFVHAGIRPGRSMAKQSRNDMLMIREPFLSSRRPLPVRVVHGHSVSFEPEILPCRIGVDTGAFATGNLSCVMLEEDRAEIFSSGATR